MYTTNFLIPDTLLHGYRDLLGHHGRVMGSVGEITQQMARIDGHC